MEIIKQPKKFRRIFLLNPGRFLLEYCNKSGSSDSPFLLFPEKLEKAYLKFEGTNPFDDVVMMFDSTWEPQHKGLSRFMHIDLAQNKCGVGISSCYSPGFVEEKIKDKGVEKKLYFPIIKFDFVGRIMASKGEEIQLPEVEALIYYLSGLGLHFKLITFDRFQSVQMRQNLILKGYTSAQMSVERCAHKIILGIDGIEEQTTKQNYLAAFESFKVALYGERMIIPYHKVADSEIRKAKHDMRRNKIEPLAGKTIDMFHSIAGSCFNLINNIIYDPASTQTFDKSLEDDFYTKYEEKSLRQKKEDKDSGINEFEDSFYYDDTYYSSEV